MPAAVCLFSTEGPLMCAFFPAPRILHVVLEGAQPQLRPLHLVVRETEFCGLRLAADFRRRTWENGRNSVRRPRCAPLTDRNCESFCRPGNRGGLPGIQTLMLLAMRS